MKYIDAEKLKAEIERRKCNAEIPDGMKSAFKPLADEIAKNFIAGAEWGAEHLKK